MNESASPQPSEEKAKINAIPEAIPFTPAKNSRFIIDDPQMSPVVKHWLIRFLVVLVGVLVLQIPLYMVKDLAEERESYASSAEAAIAAAWGKEQVIEDILSGDNLPEKLSVKSVITPEIRYRGIYQSVVYVVQNDIDMEFDKVSKFIEVGISDSNGLLDVSAEINGKSADFTLEGSNTVKIKVPENVSSKVNCSVSLKLRGTSSFAVTACGKINKIDISGAWSSPNLSEGVMPDSRQIDNDKFSAVWNINNFNRQYGDFQKASVNLKIAAGTYQQVERVMNYATFFLIVFFFTLIVGEAVSKTAIHPFQYIVAAGAPVLFYQMLLAVGEKTGFHTAYLISAAVIVAMVTKYAKMFLGRILPALIMGIIFAASYLLNFVILRMEDFALMSGTIVLAIILGVLMAVTGKINHKQENA